MGLKPFLVELLCFCKAQPRLGYNSLRYGVVMAKGDGCATCCSIMSAMGVPLMAYIGILCINNSPMIEIPAAQKPRSVWLLDGCSIVRSHLRHRIWIQAQGLK